MTPQRIAAWGVVTFALIVMAEFQPTSQLAISFAYLILLVVFLTMGVPAFSNLSAMVGATDSGSSAGKKRA